VYNIVDARAAEKPGLQHCTLTWSDVWLPLFARSGMFLIAKGVSSVVTAGWVAVTLQWSHAHRLAACSANAGHRLAMLRRLQPDNVHIP